MAHQNVCEHENLRSRLMRQQSKLCGHVSLQTELTYCYDTQVGVIMHRLSKKIK